MPCSTDWRLPCDTPTSTTEFLHCFRIEITCKTFVHPSARDTVPKTTVIDRRSTGFRRKMQTTSSGGAPLKSGRFQANPGPVRHHNAPKSLSFHPARDSFRYLLENSAESPEESIGSRLYFTPKFLQFFQRGFPCQIRGLQGKYIPGKCINTF